MSELSKKETHVQSSIVKRSIVIAGHKTSVSLENAFWSVLKKMALGRRITLSNIVSEIDTRRHQGNLSSAIRLFVLDGVRHEYSGYDRDSRREINTWTESSGHVGSR